MTFSLSNLMLAIHDNQTNTGKNTKLSTNKHQKSPMEKHLSKNELLVCT